MQNISEIPSINEEFSDDPKYKNLLSIIEKLNNNDKNLNEKLNQLVIPFPEVAPEFLIKEVKNVLVDKNQCISFVKMLVNEKIIKNKKIYQKLIDENYQ